MRLVIASEIDSKRAMVVGLAFWLGVGFQGQDVFHDLMDARWSSLLGNGMTVGGFFAIAATLLLELLEPRRSRLRIPLSRAALPDLHAFSWTVLPRGRDGAPLPRVGCGSPARRCCCASRNCGRIRTVRSWYSRGRNAAVRSSRFVAAPSDTNMEDQMLVLDGKKEFALDEVSLRLLDHAAESVRHQQYYDTDFITVRVRGGADS